MVTSESNFTEPRPDCPNPELWMANDAMSAELEVQNFIAALIHLIKPSFVIETGCHEGRTSAVIGEALAAEKRGWLATMDIEEQYVDATRVLCYDLPVKVFHVSSVNYDYPHPVDLAFLDSGVNREEEFQYFQPTFAVLHDTGPHRPGIRSAAEIDGTHWIHFPTPRGVTLVARS